MKTEQADERTARNAVSLAGRVSSEPVERELPSGDHVVSFRLVMARERTPMTARSKQVSDWVDCAAWSALARRRVASWVVGDEVELEGALRRRFFRADGGASSRLEVEVLRARRVARAPTARARG